jgi:hypothetical protein
MAPLAELGQWQRQAPCRLAVATGVTDECGAWLFGSVGPTQPDQAVPAKAGVAVQAPASAELAAMAHACPVAAVQSAQRPHRERTQAGPDVGGQRVGR